jgi:DNA repair protein RecN (Recombination protein N)
MFEFLLIQALQKEIPLDADGLEQRLDLIFRYKQKYRVATLDALCDLQETFQKELKELSVVDQSLSVIEERYTTLSTSLTALSEELHKKRVSLAKDIQKNVVQIMEKLSFSHADFRISVEKDDDKWTESGCDTVSFLVSTNAGEPPKPLSKIASGGELSRIMLAFRVVFCDANTKETMIFDEVDAGIGGLTANTVGELLKRVSEHSQVVCVTHLPQVAQFSDRHLVVEKKMEKGKTTTQLRLLMSGERDNELKRMVGGDVVVEKMGLAQKG